MKASDAQYLILEWQQALRLARGTLIEQASACEYRRGWFYRRVAQRLRDGKGPDGNGTIVPGVALQPVRASMLIELIDQLQREADRRFRQATTNAAAAFIYRDAVRACYGEEVLQRSTIAAEGAYITVALEVDSGGTALRLRHRRNKVLQMAEVLYRRSWRIAARA